MHYTELIDKLVRELSYRVGIPNVYDREHQSIMSEILTEWGEFEAKETIFNFLNEAPDDDKYTSVGYGYFVRKGDEEKEDAQKYKKDDGGNYVPVSPDQYKKDKQKQGDAGKKAAANTPQNKQGGGEEGGEQEQPETGTALKGKGGKDYTDNLPPNDPAYTGKPEKSDSPKSKVSMSNTIDRGGDSKIKNEAFKYGFDHVKDENGKTIFKPAQGNAGSLLNEIVSGEVAQMIEENPNLSNEELIDILYERFGDSKLFTSKTRSGNMSSQTAGGVKKSEIPEGKNPGLHSKLILAVKSGRRKYNKSIEVSKSNDFENPKIENYYGHKSSFDAMVNAIKDKQVIGPNGEEISQEEAEKIIRSGGGGDNPSDTGTLVFDEKSNRVILLLHSDKDSTDAIVAQSSMKAESEANDENIDKLVSEGKITTEQGEKLKEDQRELIRQNEEIEAELKRVGNRPAKFFLEKVDINRAIESIKNDTDSKGSKDKNKTSTKLKSSIYQRGKVHPSIKPYLENEKNDGDYTEQELVEAYFKFMGDDNKKQDPSNDQVTLMERLNTRFMDEGAPDLFSDLENIRNRTLQLQRDFISKQDNETIEINGQQVGLGTFLEGNTVFKQFHLEAINPNSDKGVHKYPGMFETNHAGLAVDGETLSECMGGDISTKEDFISRFEVGPLEEQKGVSGDQKGRTTGGKRIVYALTVSGERIPIGQKVMRTKSGKTGKLQTVYQWSKEMKGCFDKKGK